MLNNSQSVKVWDPVVRLFHWTLVLAFFTAYITEEDFLGIHSFAGYTVGAHNLGPDRYPPRSLPRLYLFTRHRSAIPARHLQVGGAMILLMLVSLLVTTLTGMAVYGAAEQAGPMATWFGHGQGWLSDALEETHEFFANFTLLLVFVHVAGVIVESLIHRENLVKSMVTGLKSLRNENS